MMWPQPSEYIIELLTFDEWLRCDYMNIMSNGACIYNFQHISSQGRFPFGESIQQRKAGALICYIW